MDKPHMSALATETGFLQFEEQVPFKFENNLRAAQR
jgi:hypothetical protein